MTNKASITYVDNAIAATSTRPTFTTNTLTTSSGSLNITSDIVLFKGLNGITYLDMSPTNISATTNFYIDGVLKNKNGISVGNQVGLNTWAVKCDIDSNGN
ncbi:MAG: hypothetical protein ACKPKO_51765, partial [Candidatus Fonsibacter sp.]